MAASVLSDAGAKVIVADAMPSLGRKFLMAGKSGLNLTKDEPEAQFLASYIDPHENLTYAIEAFGPNEVKDWARSLDQEIFTGSSGRVFPKVMKASPLLRAWLAQIDASVLTRHRWLGWQDDQAVFDTPTGQVAVTADATILALGGASWSRLGSDGAWADHFPDQTTRFQPSNVGLSVDWSPYMERHFGLPVKGTRLTAGDQTSRGEWIISKHGMEGGGVYTLAGKVRDGANLSVDLKPDWSHEKLGTTLQRPRGKMSFANYLRKAIKLDPPKIALLQEFGAPFPNDIAPLIKNLPIPTNATFPMDEAISTAGGLRFDALDDNFMLRVRAGVFCAGEMLDWDAPTGGYLITGCLATGRVAGLGARAYLGL